MYYALAQCLGNVPNTLTIHSIAPYDPRDCFSQVLWHIRSMSSELLQRLQVNHVFDGNELLCIACRCGQVLWSTPRSTDWEESKASFFLRNGCFEMLMHNLSQTCGGGVLLPAYLDALRLGQ